MAFPTGLFVEAPEFQDASMFSLSEDIESWPEELVQKFKERIPESTGMNIITKIMKQDEENGTATGSLLVADSKKQVVVPIIVKDFMLYPLDVMLADGKILPLTPDYFKGVFQNNGLFQKLEEYPTFGGLGRFEDANLWSATYPPSLGRYAYASAGYDILDQISDTIDPTEFKAYLKSHPEVAVGLSKHAEVIKKIANLRPVNMNEFRQGVDNLIQRPIVMLRKDGPNKYNLLSTSDEVFAPQIKQFVDREMCMSYMSKISDHAEDDMNDVDQNGEKMVATPAVNIVNNVERGYNPEIELASDFDHYVVKNKYGVEFEGVVIPKVINLEMELQALKVFIGKTMSTVQPEIAGIRLKNSRYSLKKHEPLVGQTGVFVYQPDKSKALCTIPMVIKSLTCDGGCSLKVTAMDLLGVGYKLKFGVPGMQDLQRIARVAAHEYDMPEKFFWVPMEGFQEVTNSPADFAAKTAAQTITDRPVTIISTGYSRYSLRGVNKYAQAIGWDPTNLGKAETTFLLHALGASGEKVAESLKTAGRTGYCAVHGLNFVPLKEEKIAAAVPMARKMAGIAKDLRCNLTKEASYVENTQTVDALLALNFVTSENVSKFVGKLPSFKSAISNLASCIIASRLGIQEIPEQAASTAMYRLIDVVNGLESLRATQESEAQ